MESIAHLIAGVKGIKEDLIKYAEVENVWIKISVESILTIELEIEFRNKKYNVSTTCNLEAPFLEERLEEFLSKVVWKFKKEIDQRARFRVVK